MTSEQIGELDEEGLALFPLDIFLKQYNTSKFEVGHRQCVLRACMHDPCMSLLEQSISPCRAMQFAKSRAFQAQQNIAQSEEELVACRAETQRLRRIRVLLTTMEQAADQAIRLAGDSEAGKAKLGELKSKVAEVTVD